MTTYLGELYPGGKSSEMFQTLEFGHVKLERLCWQNVHEKMVKELDFNLAAIAPIITVISSRVKIWEFLSLKDDEILAKCESLPECWKGPIKKYIPIIAFIIRCECVPPVNGVEKLLRFLSLQVKILSSYDDEFDEDAALQTFQ